MDLEGILKATLELPERLDERIKNFVRPCTELCDKLADNEPYLNRKYLGSYWWDRKQPKSNFISSVINFVISSKVTLSMTELIFDNDIEKFIFFCRQYFLNSTLSIIGKYYHSHTGLKDDGENKILEDKFTYCMNNLAKETRIYSVIYGGGKVVKGVIGLSQNNYEEGVRDLVEGLAWAASGLNTYLIQATDEKPKKYNSLKEVFEISKKLNSSPVPIKN